MHGSTSYKIEAKQEAAATGYFLMYHDSIYRKFAIVIAACRASCHALTARISAIGFTMIHNQQIYTYTFPAVVQRQTNDS